MSLTATELLRLNVKAETAWADSALKNSLVKQTEAVKAVLENQTAKFTQFDDTTKDNKIGIDFINPCGDNVRDCVTDNCDIVEAELSTGRLDLEPNICKEIGFSVNEEKLRTNRYNLEDLYAEGVAEKLGLLDEYLSVKVLADLKTYAGVNAHAEPFTFNNVAKTTEVPSAGYNLGLIPQMINDSFMNKMGNTYFIDNGSLWADFFNAQMNAGNLDGKGQDALIKQVKFYFDQFNFNKAGISEDTFMISKSAVALKTVNKFENKMRVFGGKVAQTRFQIKSPNLDGVMYDAIYQENCINGEIVHAWRFYLRGLFALNPKGCPISVNIGGVPTTVQQTGVLSYSKV